MFGCSGWCCTFNVDVGVTGFVGVWALFLPLMERCWWGGIRVIYDCALNRFQKRCFTTFYSVLFCLCTSTFAGSVMLICVIIFLLWNSSDQKASFHLMHLWAAKFFCILFAYINACITEWCTHYMCVCASGAVNKQVLVGSFYTSFIRNTYSFMLHVIMSRNDAFVNKLLLPVRRLARTS